MLRPLYSAILLLALAWPVNCRADALADLHAAVQEASAQYRIAMSTLETSSREQTAFEVQRFRSAWQVVMNRFGSNRPADFATDEEFPSVFMQIDLRIVGALIVIDIGSRDAARDGLTPIGDILARLRERSAPLR
jgi:hypothetical protein